MRRKLIRAISRFRHRTLGLPRLAVRPSDVFVVSWPRSGNTWMRHLLFNTLYPHEEWDLTTLDQRMPRVEQVDLRRLLPALDREPRRFFKSHEPFFDYFLGGRVIYIVRDGRDAVASLYHYRRQVGYTRGSFSSFLRDVLNGKLGWGAWHTHVAGWLEHKENPALCVVRYENMLADAASELRRVLQHIDVQADAAAVDRAVERSSLGAVTRGFQKGFESRGRTFKSGLGGRSGSWQQLFSDEDLALFRQHAGETMKRAGYDP